jgi:L-threonylcarbamoyladenylate synthase
MPDILHIDPVNPEEAKLDRAAETLRNGGLIVSPTETRYGLLTSASNAEAVTRLCRAKGRDFNRPVAVFVRDLDSLTDIARMTDMAAQLAASFLPGPLTLVLKAAVNWSSPLVVDGKIGIRISSSPIVAGLVERVGPLTATSANTSGAQEPLSIKDAEEQLGAAVDLYLDVGDLGGPVSTVVDCSGGLCDILRAGAIEPDRIFNAVKELQNSE